MPQAGLAVADIISVMVRERKLEGPGFFAEKKAGRMTRANWLELRRSGLGGSDTGSLMFPDDNSGPLTVYMSKVTKDDGFDGNDFTDYGSIMEGVLRETFLPTKLSRIGGKGFKVFTSPWLYRRVDRPHTFANIDGLIEFEEEAELEDGVRVPAGLYVLELKTAAGFKRDKWANGEIPDRYYAQVQHYMGVLDLPGAVVFGLVDRTPEFRFVPRNDEFIDLINTRCDDLWARVQTEDPPMAFGGSGDIDALALLYPDTNGKGMVDLDGLQPHALAYLEAKAEIKRLDATVKEHEAWMKSTIQDNLGICEGVLASAKWSRWETERFDSKRFKEEHPELAGEYIKTSTGGRLTVKAQGIEEE